MGAGHQKDPESPSHEEKVGTFSCTCHSPERREGLEIESMINHGYMMKPPQKCLNYRVQRASRLGNVPGG